MDNNEKNNHNYFVKVFFLIALFVFFVSLLEGTFDDYIHPDSAVIKHCDDGYILKSSKCVKIIESIEPNYDYYCDENYELDGNKCIMYEYQEANVKWYCNSGYTMGKAKYPDLCYKYTTDDYHYNYYCDYGYNLVGSKCEKQTVVSPNENNTVCSNGNYNYEMGVCVLVGVYTSCPSGTNVLIRNGRYVTCYSYPRTIKTCPEGSTSNGTKCEYPKEVVDAHSYRACSSGFEYNSQKQQCIHTDYEVPYYSLSCNDSFVLGDGYCYKTYVVDAHYNMLCEEGYELDNGYCVKYDIVDPTYR